MDSKYLSPQGNNIKGLYALENDITCHFLERIWENTKISPLLNVLLVGKMQIKSCSERSIIVLPETNSTASFALQLYTEYSSKIWQQEINVSEKGEKAMKKFTCKWL